MSELKPKILCVDDEEAVLTTLEILLRSSGYEVIKASNGAEALKILREERVDLVILDIKMPTLDGFEVCRRIKADKSSMHIPVVLITGFIEKEDRVKGIEAGAEDFISKPYDRAELIARIKMLLKVKQVHERRIGELLIDMNFISEEQLQEALRISKEQRIKVGEALISMGALDKDHVYWVLSNQLNMNYIEPSLEMVDRELIRHFSIDTLERLQCLPLYETLEEIHFAIANPTEQEIQRAIANLNPLKKAHLHLALPEKIEAILEAIKRESHFLFQSVRSGQKILDPPPFAAGKLHDIPPKESSWDSLADFFLAMSPHEVCWLSRDAQECHLISQKGKDLQTVYQYAEETFDILKQRLRRQIRSRNAKGLGYFFLQPKTKNPPGVFRISFLNGLGQELIQIARLPQFSSEDFLLNQPQALNVIKNLQQLFEEHRRFLIGGGEPLMIKQYCYSLLRTQGHLERFPPAFFIEDEIEMYFPEVTQLSSHQSTLSDFLASFKEHFNPLVFYEASTPESLPDISQILSGPYENMILYIPFSSMESMEKALPACQGRGKEKFPTIFLRANQLHIR